MSEFLKGYICGVMVFFLFQSIITVLLLRRRK